MRRLNRIRGASAKERGATAVIVAILLPVVLLGVGAFAVDVGNWYATRAQTQNGADAGAMKVAQACANGSCTPGAATPYAASNANNAFGANPFVKTVCGNGPGLTACPASIENGAACPSTHPANYVDVLVGAKDVPSMFGKFLGRDAQDIGACTQATWGPPSGLGNAVALTISACEWTKNTTDAAGNPKFATIPSGSYSAGAPYYTSPPSYLATINSRRSDPDYNTTPNDNSTNFYVASKINDPHTPALNAPVAGSETVITTHGFGNTCRAGNPGWAAPGQFGWLSKTTCAVPISGNTYTGVTGNTPAPCGPMFLNSLQTKTPLFLPVYTSSTLSGTNTVYQLDGFAAFVVTGWDVGGGVNQWNLNGSNVPTRWDSEIELQDTSSLTSQEKAKDAHYCNDFTAAKGNGNADVCIYGYFTKALIPASAVPTGGNSGPPPNNLGATAPFLTG